MLLLGFISDKFCTALSGNEEDQMNKKALIFGGGAIAVVATGTANDSKTMV